MPRTRGEGNKKHGDELQSLIERTGGDPSPRERKESADDESELGPTRTERYSRTRTKTRTRSTRRIWTTISRVTIPTRSLHIAFHAQLAPISSRLR